MSKLEKPLVGHFEPPHVSLRGYVTGFVGSLVLTVLAYGVTVSSGASRDIAIAAVAVCALAQASLQLIYFLHLGHEFKPRWKLWVFMLMLVVVMIVVGGSLWIMSNLNYRMMYSPEQMQHYVQGQDGL